MKHTTLVLLLLIMVSSFTQAKNLTIQKSSVVPKIDSNGDSDWTGIVWQAMDQHKGDSINKNNTAKFKF